MQVLWFKRDLTSWAIITSELFAVVAFVVEVVVAGVEVVNVEVVDVVVVDVVIVDDGVVVIEVVVVEVVGVVVVVGLTEELIGTVEFDMLHTNIISDEHQKSNHWPEELSLLKLMTAQSLTFPLAGAPGLQLS